MEKEEAGKGATTRAAVTPSGIAIETGDTAKDEAARVAVEARLNGSVLVDGVDIRSLDVKYLRRRVTRRHPCALTRVTHTRHSSRIDHTRRPRLLTRATHTRHSSHIDKAPSHLHSLIQNGGHSQIELLSNGTLISNSS